MIIPIGTRKGELLESIVLKDPGYIAWLVQQEASGPLLAMKNEAKRLVSILDAKPFVTKCRNCGAPAVQASVYVGNVETVWWCGKCDPYQLGANNGKLQLVRTYSQALQHVEFNCRGRKADYKELVKNLAVAKGLPKRVGNAQAAKFFSL